MPDPNVPTLGYGQRSEAPIDSVNQWMRSTPWYNSLIKSFGQWPGNIHLNDQQKQQIIRAAQANGVVVDEGGNGQEIDNSGNFRAKGHGLRNTLIIAGIAAAALATMGAAGVFAGGAAGAGAGAGAGAAGAGAAGAGAGAGTGGALASTAIGSGFVPGIAGGAGLAAGTGAGVGAGIAAGAAGAAPIVAGTAPHAANWLTGPGVIPGLIGAGTNLAGAFIQTNANTEAAKIQAEATQRALEEAKRQYDYNIKFQREKYDYGNTQYTNLLDRLNPYIAAGSTSTDRMSELLGLPPRAPLPSRPTTPSYGPSAPSSGPAPSPSGPPGTVSGEKGDVGKQVEAYFASRGVTPNPTSAAYWAQKWNEFGAHDPEYFNRRLSQADEFSATPTGPSSTSTAPSTQPAPPLTSAHTTAQPVLLKGPDGSTKLVPPNEVDYYKSLGAVLA